MTRHGKNCTAGAVYTYHERKKDTEASGYGTKKARLGKDSLKDFECCNLTLQPCKDPVVTAEGFLYEREAIVEYMLKRKREISKQLKAYEEFLSNQKKKQEAESVETQLNKIESFVTDQNCILSRSSISGSARNKADAINPNSCFWVPEVSARNAKCDPTQMKKPNSQVTCPMSGKPLRIKDLIDVHFTPTDKKCSSSFQTKYMCALTHDALSNSTPCVVLRPSGQVITVDALDRLVRTEMMDPWKNVKLNESDVVLLQRGASGFSGSGVELQAEKYAPSLSIS